VLTKAASAMPSPPNEPYQHAHMHEHGARAVFPGGVIPHPARSSPISANLASKNYIPGSKRRKRTLFNPPSVVNSLTDNKARTASGLHRQNVPVIGMGITTSE